MSLPCRVERIVLVDDSHADNVFHEVIIRRSGFTGDLKVFEQPAQALEYLRSVPDGPVCLVLLDINMPGMDGWEFAKAAEPFLADRQTVVLVMLTSSSAPSDLERARQLPAVRGYITKPLDKQAATELLQAHWEAFKP